MTIQLIEKMKKLKVMAERGTEHEAKVARAKLNNLLNEYGISEEQIMDHEKKVYRFPVKTTAERSILFGIIRKVLRIPDVSYFKYARNTKSVGIELTKTEHLLVTEYLATYQKLFRKELEKIQDQFVMGFVSKHQLMNPLREEKSDDNESSLTPEEIEEIINMMRKMKTVSSPQEQIA